MVHLCRSVRIKPVIDHTSSCPRCRTALGDYRLLWQGIHVCVTSVCPGCGSEVVEDLPVGHSVVAPCVAIPSSGELWGEDMSRRWYGEPLLSSLRTPDADADVSLSVERVRPCGDVIILNCIDYLYGHALLKLLNAAEHLEKDSDAGLIIIVQRFLRWMVPEGVAEVWTVDLPLSKAQAYYPKLDSRIRNECARFESIRLSRALPHPANFNITAFTRVPKHDFNRVSWRLTYVWREDRPWWNPPSGYALPLRAATKLRLKGLILLWQNWKIRRLFGRLRRSFPDARFTVAGFGTSTSFPGWVDDVRTSRFTPEVETAMCQVYSESRLVVGVHGSSMLLPSAHAGMTTDLMPNGRWGNLAQDILYQTNQAFGDDPRLSSWRYRYIPMRTSVRTLATILTSQLDRWRRVVERFRSPEAPG